MKIRPATINDAPQIQNLNENQLHYDYSIDKTTKMIDLILKLDWQKIFVAEVESKVVGYVHGSKYLGTFSDPLVNIMGIAVDSKFQGKGVGKMLMAAAEQWGLDNGAIGVRLNSGEERLEAHEFYEKIGYQKLKKQVKFQKMFSVNFFKTNKS